jgi:hypothetical protein
LQFADLLTHEEKTIGLRKWKTKFRGKFLIHASKNIDTEACERLDIDIDNSKKEGMVLEFFRVITLFN